MLVGMPITVTMKDGDVHTTQISCLAQAEIEEQRDSDLYTLLFTGRRQSDQYLLAWHCLRCDEIKVKPFKQWLAGVASIEFDWQWADPKDNAKP